MIAKKDNKYFIALFSFLLLLGFVFSPIVVTFGQESEIWMKSYGGPNDDDCFSALLALDGGYILAGDTASLGVGETDVLLIKTDSTGIIPEFSTFQVLLVIVTLTLLIIIHKTKLSI